jgi:hypothetical protein
MAEEDDQMVGAWFSSERGSGGGGIPIITSTLTLNVQMLSCDTKTGSTTTGSRFFRNLSRHL